MRKWRVGTISMGVLLVAVGLLLLVSEIQGLNGARMILRWWPVVLVILGLEILAYIVFSREEQPKIKFDGLSIFLVIMIILVSSGVYSVNRFINSDFSRMILGEIGYFEHESIVNKTYDIEAANVKKLQINNSRGEVQVDRYDGDTIKVDAAIIIQNNNEEKAMELAQDLIEVTEGETLTLTTRHVSVLEDNKNYQFTINYAVKVPKALTYEINNKFGEIDLEDLTGDVLVDGEFGKVEVENIQGHVRIENSFGETRVIDVSGSVEVKNEHGEIYYRNAGNVSENITLTCKMGGVTVELPRSQKGTFDAYTQFGDIQFEGFGTDLTVDRDETKQELKGTIETASPVIRVNADHGSISLKGQ